MSDDSIKRIDNKSRPPAVWVLVVLHFLIGVGSLISGGMLLVKTDGGLLGWDLSLLAGTPFNNFIIPGIILVLLLGVFPVFVGFGLLKKPAWRWPDVINPMKRSHWAWTASWATGVILLIWIIVELFIVGYISILQPIVVIWGLATIILTLLTGVKLHYRRS